MSWPKNPPIRVSRRRSSDLECMSALGLAVLVFFMVITLFDVDAENSRGVSIASGTLAILIGTVTILAAREKRTFKLRLISNGVRVTERHRTTNWLEPRIQNPERPAQTNFIKLTAENVPKKKLELDLSEFDLRDRIAIIEHVSQFLSPEQQAAHGKNWVKWHTKLLDPRKPMNWWRGMVIFHASCFAGLALIAAFYGVVQWRFPIDFGYRAPEFWRTLFSAFGVMMIAFDSVFGLAWLLERRDEKDHRELVESIVAFRSTNGRAIAERSTTITAPANSSASVRAARHRAPC